jgi:chaperonin cofactor prefoldin
LTEAKPFAVQVALTDLSNLQQDLEEANHARHQLETALRDSQMHLGEARAKACSEYEIK